ncbi:GSCOCT00006737001.2-RA-CDS [Cotesia congregata]|uniref:Cc_odve66_15 n=1 Tax=Cotesia congregata TaxID=51543 RepID=A0A8J2H6J7_COTCN|nr:GSCOCT00006737001.2-RA-CDS [Cotesia congregata]CAG5078884.1 Cc_odve66_15 [Cotesia congregata]
MIFRKVRLFLIIYICVMTMVSLMLLNYDTKDTTDRMLLIRDAMVSSYSNDLRLWTDEIIMTKAWVFMTDDDDAEGVPHSSFEAWRCDDNVFMELCNFGGKLLVLWARSGSLEHLSIAEDIIRRSLTAMNKFEYLLLYPWGENWYAFSVSLPKLLSMYIYLGDNEELKRKCCRLMMRMVTKLDRSLSITRTGMNVAYLGIPRLCATYYFDRKIFEQETQWNENPFIKLKEQFHINFNRSPAIFDGVYADGTCIEHKNVVTFSYFATLDGFYEYVYHALGFPSNVRDIACQMLSKVLHPDIPWLPFGLFGRTGNRRRIKQWWNITGSKEGIELMPFAGVAVFKTPESMITVRVQQPGFAAYETDKTAKGEFALGWIQLRRIYIKGVDYPDPLEWKVLKDEPGLIVPADGQFLPLVGGKNSTTVIYECEPNSINSFVGRLESELLFWKNEYNFRHAYDGDCFVKEAAVVTSHGLEAYYEIENKSGKNLKFIWKDNNYKLAVNDVSVDYEGNSVSIPTGETKKFNWRMLISTGIDSKVRIDQGNLTFESNGVYTVKVLKKNEKFVVLKGDKPVLVGTNSSVPDDYVLYEKKKYRRDPKNFMYRLE